MPQRFLRPGITTSDRWNSVSFEAQSFYIRILTLVDDFGRHDARVPVLHGQCFALRNDIKPQRTAALRGELHAAKLIDVYEVDGREYLQVTQWQERARSERSKIPDKPQMVDISTPAADRSGPQDSAASIAITSSPLHQVPAPVPPTPTPGAPASPPLGQGRKKADRIPTTSHAIRIAQLFGRKLTTAWSEKEVRRFKALGTIEDADLASVEHYYRIERAKGSEGIHRRDLLTFLNNWTGELDRARAASAKVKPGKALEWAPCNVVPMPAPSPEEIERGLAELRRFKQEARK